MKITPFPVGPRILVRQMKKKVAESGIIVTAPENEDALKLPKGEVVQVGISNETMDLHLEKGDIVYFNPFAGTTVKFGPEGEEEECLLLSPHEVLLKEVKEDTF